ncbi:MAG: HEAT repeat domain-containing protein [Planctomycetia bacterium]|nr:HEAT repeat domain-containing protein [Planctomycetia bacterium]
MSRPTRGVPLPSFWQVLGIVAVAGAAYWLWQNSPRQSGPADAEGLGANLRGIEELSDRGADAIPDLVAMLSSSDRKSRYLALQGLGRLGERASGALDAVCDALRDDDREVRSNALWAFTQICSDSESLWPTIARMLADPDAGIRESAAGLLDGRTTHHIAWFARRQPDALGRRLLTADESRQMNQTALAMIDSDRAETRGLVIRVVTAQHSLHDDPEVTAALRRLLGDSEPVVRASAISALGKRGVARVEEIHAGLRDADSRVVDEALQSANWLGPEAVQIMPDLLPLADTIPDFNLPALIRVLRLDRAAAKMLLRRLVRRAGSPEFQAPIRSAARPDPAARQEWQNPEIRKRLDVVAFVMELGAEPTEFRPVLKSLIANSHPELGKLAAGLLTRFDPDEARRLAGQMTVDIERDPNREGDSPSMRSLHVLSGFGPAARDAVPLLIRLIDEDDQKRPWIAWYSIVALGGIGPDAAPAVTCLSSVLKRLKSVDNSWVRGEVVVATLGKIGPAARSTVPVLLEILDQAPNSEHEAARPANTAAAQSYPVQYDRVSAALGRIGDNSDRVVARLWREAAVGRPVQRRLAALQALLGLCRHGDPIPSAFLAALDDESVDVRLVAACLGQVEGDRSSAIPGLIRALTDDDPWVVSAAALSLRAIGPAAVSAAPKLRELTADVRNRAPNGIRSSHHYGLASLRFDPGGHDLSRLSVTEAARLALESIVRREGGEVGENEEGG